MIMAKKTEARKAPAKSAVKKPVIPSAKGLIKKPAAKPLKSMARKVAEPPKPSKSDLYFNGKLITRVDKAGEFVDSIRKKRRMNLISHQLNIAYYPQFNEIKINTEHGRARRPLVIVENGKPRFTDDLKKKLLKGQINWNYLVQKGVIEYLDAEEEENAYIAITPEEVYKSSTHLELNPVTILGISASLIPYMEYNRGDRINYGAKMVGQSISLMTKNFLTRTDTKFNVMTYPQVPLIKADISTILLDHPAGQNVTVAIMCYDGYNMNDAIVINKSSIDRGLFRSFYFRTYETIKKKYWGGQEDEIMIPEPGIKGHMGEEAYQDLAEDGLINLEIAVESDSVLVGKVSPLRFLSGEEFATGIENKRDTSITVRYGERGVVDEIFISETADSYNLFKIRIRDQRMLEIGDKLASRHGQKGIISHLVPQEDMPFSPSGTIPDIIFNPHAIPSRMTVGQLLELIAGKAKAYSCREITASAFDHIREDEIRKLMKNMGFRDDGKQALYDGRTGRMYDVMIFTGLSYYMKLDHMVADKIHTRSRGPVTLLTKQPTEGRAKRGGLRLGEMEQQCLVGHGAAMVLKERFNSDRAVVPVCKKCGLIAIHDVAKNKNYCPICKNSEVGWVELSYAFKLMLDEMTSMGVSSRLGIEEV
jgi:DNA-directed RNA polymerase subunit B'